MSPKTWQSILDDLTFKVQGNSALFKKIRKCTSEEDLVRCLACDSNRKILSEWIDSILKAVPWEKCGIKASSFREQGNIYFCSKDYYHSLEMYNESIKHAPIGREELALSYANRSASLFHLQLYTESIVDINRACKHSYPINLQYKLHQRKAECLLQLGRSYEAVEQFQLAQKSLCGAVDISEARKSYLLQSIEKSMCTAMKNINVTDDSPGSDNTDEFFLPSLFHGQNENFPSASKAICIKKSKEKGRYVVAQCDISVGDILFVERPFAFVLLPEHYTKRCHHCCKSLKTPVPCCNCCTPLYCDEQCQKNSWDLYHKWECHGGLNMAHAVGIAHLGLRVTLNAGTLEDHRAFAKGQAIRKDSYASVYYLLTHLTDMPVDDRIAYTLTAVCLMLYLSNHSDYFTPVSQDHNYKESKNDEIFMGALILRHICQLVCNGHAIVDLEATSDVASNVVEEKQVRLATAIYPSASMMNHSCDPNIVNSFSNVHLIVKASKHIPVGEEIFNCYGPNFRTMSRNDRQVALKAQYCFRCTCEHCSELQEFDFQARFRAMQCPTCEGPLVDTEGQSSTLICLHCKEHIPSSSVLNLACKAHILYEYACSLVDRNLWSEALEQFHECSDFQLQCLYKNHEERRGCLNKIAMCYAKLGDYRNSIYFLLQTLPALEEQFGSSSIEMANELQTLTDVMCSDIIEGESEYLDMNCKRALEYVLKAKSIFELHYGPWNSSFQEIMKKEENLNKMILGSELCRNSSKYH